MVLLITYSTTIMNVIVNLLLLLISVNAEGLDLAFQQHDYQVKFERVEIVRFNKKFMKEFQLATHKYNRTMAVVNSTLIFKVDIPILLATVQVYKFMSNEYRYFPIHFAANACQAISLDTAGIRSGFERCGNIIGCPFLKGIKYEVCNWYPDPSKLPPSIPNGQYKIELQLQDSTEEEVGVLSVLMTASRPIV